MTRILIRSSKDPFERIRPVDAFIGKPRGFFGSNSGNLLFGDAVHRLLSVEGNELTADRFAAERSPESPREIAARINAEYDHYVIPLANALRVSFADSLDRLTETIRHLTIPVTIAGIGIQFGIDKADWMPKAKVQASHRAFVDAVLDHGPALGLRGKLTEGYLRRLGYPADALTVIGCPAVFLRGPDVHVRQPQGELLRTDPISLSVAPDEPGFAPFVDRAVQEYDDLVYLPQREWELKMILSGSEPKYSKEQLAKAPDPRYPVHHDHPLYQRDQVRFFVDTVPWVDFHAGRRFAVGNRIHGTIAALVAGTPAMIVPMNARTLEIADYHAIPYITIKDLPADATVADLWERADFNAFNAVQPDRFARLSDFLTRAGLGHHTDTPTAYDARLRATRHAPGLRTVNAKGLEAARQRIERISLKR